MSRLFQTSDVEAFTIAAAADGSEVDPIDFGRSYKAFFVKCEDAQYIPASTELSAEVGLEETDDMVPLYEQDDPSTEWSKGSLPTSGSFGFVLTHAFGVRRLRLILSNASTGGSTVFKVRGIDGGNP